MEEKDTENSVETAEKNSENKSENKPQKAKDKRQKSRKKVLVIKLIAVALAIITAVSISVFSNTIEVNQRSIVTMMGIDKTEDGDIVVSAHMLVSTPGIMENEFRQDLSTVSGRNIFEALSKFNVAKARKVEFSQCGLVVFGSSIADNGILNIAKALLASNTLSGGVLVLATEGDACDFLQEAAELGEMTTEHIARFLTRFQNTLEMPMAVLLSYLNGELSESGASFMPIVRFKASDENCHEVEEESDGEKEENGDNSDDSDDGDEEETAEEAQEEEPPPLEEAQTDISSVNTAAVFKSGKKVGILTAQETLGLTLIKNESRRGRLMIDGFSVGEQNFGSVLSEVRSKSVRKNTKFVDGKPKIIFNLRVNLDVQSVHEFAYLIDYGTNSQADIYASIQDAYATKIKDDITAALTASKNLDADFINLKARFSRTQNREMQIYTADENNNFLADLEYEVNVTVRAR